MTTMAIFINDEGDDAHKVDSVIATTETYIVENCLRLGRNFPIINKS